VTLDGRRVAVTGAGGRLGRAAIAAFGSAGADVVAWSRPDYDLDDPGAAERLVRATSPDLVIHAAAWTDVDGCARDPVLAARRNGQAVGELGRACAGASIGLVVISTNEVFDGTRTDGTGYREDDPTSPPNPYGASKLAGEQAAASAFAARPTGADLWIARTSWLFGPPGNDFPARILAAADRLPSGQPLKVVADEFGSPTSVADLAEGLVSLVQLAPSGVYHLVNAGHTSRLGWAERVLDRHSRPTVVEPMRQVDYQRPSKPPAWGVLATDRAAVAGVRLPSWQSAVDAYAVGSGAAGSAAAGTTHASRTEASRGLS
jgi:dTDP-4-dehydrorhamnose reductase